MHPTVRLSAMDVAGITGGAEGYKSGRGKRKSFFCTFFFFFIITDHKREQYIDLHTVGELRVVCGDPKKPIGRLLIRIDQ